MHAHATQSEPRPWPRWSLALLGAAHAAVLASVAAVVPWRSWTALSLACGATAALHAATAVLAALGHRWLATVWRAQACASLALFAYVTWGLALSAVYVRSVYEGLGDGVAAALLAADAVVALVTVPGACWGLAATGGWLPGPRAGRGAAALAALVGVAAAARLVERHRAGAPAALDSATAADAVEAALAETIRWDELPAPPGRPPGPANGAPVACPSPPGAGLLQLVAHYVAAGDGRARAATRCLEATNVDALLTELSRVLGTDALRAPMRIDLIVARGALPPEGEPLASGVVRAGLDGVCLHTRCLLPWQLVALDAFLTYQVVPTVADARLGVDLAALRRRLADGASPPAPLVRIATRGWLVGHAGVRRLGRTPQPDLDLDGAAVAIAERAAESYIVRAQRPDGSFNYLVDPFSGRVQTGGFSIARQAGTTLALCELGRRESTVDLAIERSLGLLASFERRIGDRAVLRRPPDAPGEVERIGPAALALVALLGCRSRAGTTHDALIGRIARMLLSQQRPDGGFHHHLHLADGSPAPRSTTLYADGQVVLGLVLLERVAPEIPEGPSHDDVRATVERAMGYFGGRYWDHFAGDVFFIEENWHCIAAAAALGHHRHDAYERFCLDYVRFKRRFVHGAGAPADLIGGFGVGTMVPPHNTATAGFGEALGAALAVARARGLDTRADEHLMRDVMRFLVRNQIREASCFGCVRRPSIDGGFPEHMAAPKIRIDYVQHAWAAIGHGARALGLAGDRDGT